MSQKPCQRRSRCSRYSPTAGTLGRCCRGTSVAPNLRPYYSPIYVQAITPRKSGHGALTVLFINALYAAGVQKLEAHLLVLKRERTYLIAEIEDDDDRAAIIGEISVEWLMDVLPHWFQIQPPDNVKEPYITDVQLYLDERFGVSSGYE
jgi:hypothetical protein